MTSKEEFLKHYPYFGDYTRRETIEAKVGDLGIGGQNPIRLQSMTTIDTMDTQGSIDQSIKMIDAGCELVRITAPSINEAKNLEAIRKGLRSAGYDTPLVADIHFTPNAAEYAAKVVEKVRVNPGNYADKKRFDIIDYTDDEYSQEIDRIREKFVPLVKICKEHGTAMRIGTNHGSLSDRIMSRYGDTPHGMVESALEFIRICEEENYFNLVVSMKSSNPQVMVQAYRMLVGDLDKEGLKPYPLHLGVTEAGEGEDGRIKSAVGIGTLLEEGIGDTVRVSLTEEPELEIPVAKKLVDRYENRKGHNSIDQHALGFDPLNFSKRASRQVDLVGGEQVPRVIADLSLEGISEEALKGIGHVYLNATDKWTMTDTGVDYVYVGKKTTSTMPANGLKLIADYDAWKVLDAKTKEFTFPIGDWSQLKVEKEGAFFVKHVGVFTEEQLSELKESKDAIVVLSPSTKHGLVELKNIFSQLINEGVKNPVVLDYRGSQREVEDLQLEMGADLGGLLIDGLCDGVLIAGGALDVAKVNNATFGVLQASRTRITRTEYISCPSCGRTLFDLQETTAMIRSRTDHLKGVKIGIMGCIVNGPGEMADADYGYVGSGKGKITLYRGMNVVKKSVPTLGAVDELIEIIKDDGRWVEPKESVESIT